MILQTEIKKSIEGLDPHSPHYYIYLWCGKVKARTLTVVEVVVFG